MRISEALQDVSLDAVWRQVIYFTGIMLVVNLAYFLGGMVLWLVHGPLGGSPALSLGKIATTMPGVTAGALPTLVIPIYLIRNHYDWNGSAYPRSVSIGVLLLTIYLVTTYVSWKMLAVHLTTLDHLFRNGLCMTGSEGVNWTWGVSCIWELTGG